jgi:2-deoxy-D-gluconate 3-dehydrogenase
MHPSFNLTNSIALVTGASKGIGYGLSKCLASAGAKVIVAAREVSLLSDLVKEIEAEGGEAFAVKLDITNISEIKQVFDQIAKQFGRLDILVNNAGLGFNHAAVDVSEKDWDQMMDVNLKGLFFCAQAAGKIMLLQKSGRIINISSQASLVGIKDHVVYCASKGGVNQLTRVLALEWAKDGVTVNAVAPTFTYTPGTAERLDNPEYSRGVLDRIPAGRVLSIDDIGGAVIYLASAAGGMVNGSVLVVDGGWTAQ